MTRTLVQSIAAAILLCVAALHAEGLAQARSHDDDWLAPSKEAARMNPLVAHPDAARGGAKIFEQRCANCHGDEGRGTSKAPDLAHADVQAQTDGALFWKISTGNSHARMPSFSYLPELQRWQLVLHLRSLQP